MQLLFKVQVLITCNKLQSNVFFSGLGREYALAFGERGASVVGRLFLESIWIILFMLDHFI